MQNCEATQRPSQPVREKPRGCNGSARGPDLDGQLGIGAVALPYEVLGTRLEIVKDILLVQQ